MIDMERRLVCTALPRPAHAALRSGDSELVERVRKKRDFAVGDVRGSSVSGQPILPLVGPVFDSSGEIRYLFVATIDVAWLNREIRRVRCRNTLSCLSSTATAK